MWSKENRAWVPMSMRPKCGCEQAYETQLSPSSPPSGAEHHPFFSASGERSFAQTHRQISQRLLSRIPVSNAKAPCVSSSASQSCIPDVANSLDARRSPALLDSRVAPKVSVVTSPGTVGLVDGVSAWRPRRSWTFWQSLVVKFVRRAALTSAMYVSCAYELENLMSMTS